MNQLSINADFAFRITGPDFHLAVEMFKFAKWSLQALTSVLLAQSLVLSPQSAAAVNSHGAGAGRAAQCDQLGWILNQLSNLVNFYASDPEGINADGYFGLSLSKDVLELVQLDQTPCREHAALLRSILARQNLLAQRWKSRLTGKSLYDSATYRRICKPLSKLVRPLLSVIRNARIELSPAMGLAARTDENLSDRPDIIRQFIEYQESSGDNCLVEALSPTPGNICKAQGKTCAYFDRDLDESTGYYLTHQLVYKIVRHLTDCSGEYSQLSPGRLPADLARLCAKALAEFRLIERANWTAVALVAGDNFASGLRDLYIEQGLVCGLIGVSSFYRAESLSTVASWQNRDSGCFKLFTSGSAAEPGQLKKSSGFRRILRDAEMLGGCSSHTSGVAMGYYGNAIRFLANA